MKTQHPRSGARAGILAALALGIPLGLAGLPAQAVTPASDGRGQDGAPGLAQRPDNRPGPLTRGVEKNRAKAVALVRNGAAELEPQPGGGATVELADGEFVEFPVEKTDKVWTVLSQFGTEGSGRFGRTPGPLHNEIPRPDRTQDNSTVWTEDFDLAHYEEMFNGEGESFKDYFSRLSSGRYTAVNTVEDWVTVPGNGSSYGDNAIEDDGGSWAFIGDTVDAWYAGQVAAGRSTAEIDAYLSQFDEWDRYDFDSDGDFNEPDGYIDHFQAVHAGEGEEAGADPDAIWSHRWYVDSNLFGQAGPTVDGQANLLGGTQIGQSRYFVGDYTVEPENGGLGVFAHEFGHDLGLPDFYDTAGGENGTAFWTLMSSGSWLGHGGQDEGIGTTPGLMGPEEKLYLGWLDLARVGLGETEQVTLGASQHTYEGQDQAVQVELPPSTRTAAYTTPPAGAHAWWSGRGDGLNNTLTTQVPEARAVTVSAQVWHQIEAGYDYLHGEWSTDGGRTWQPAGSPIDGASRGWTTERWSYRPGAPSLFRFRYQTDGGVNEAGAFLDSISIAADRAVVVSDGAEDGTGAWDVRGWTVSTGTETTRSTRYYLLENRQYVGYDATLENGPYNFSEAVTRPNWVEHFAFQPGMLVWLVDQGLADNNTSVHPGEGYALPVDARPAPFSYPDGTRPSNRRQPFDATFGLTPVPRTCLHKQDSSGATLEACAPASQAMPVFDDSDPDRYWDPANPQSSVRVAGHGVTATVVSQQGTSLVVEVVNPVAPPVAQQ